MWSYGVAKFWSENVTVLGASLSFPGTFKVTTDQGALPLNMPKFSIFQRIT